MSGIVTTSLGGWSETRPANEKVSELSKLMWKPSEEDTKRKFNEFKAIEYRSQCVKGYKYVIKVQVGENDYVHLQIFQGLQQEPTFEGVETGCKRDSRLDPFQPFD